MPFKAISFASNIVELYKGKSYSFRLTPQRLHRLIFLYHLHYLKQFNKHFLDDEFTAFKLGGIVREVYSNYRSFFYVVDSPATYVERCEKNGFIYLPYPSISLNEDEKSFLIRFINNYNHLDEWQLADLCIELMKKEGVIEYDIITKRQLVNMSSCLNNI